MQGLRTLYLVLLICLPTSAFALQLTPSSYQLSPKGSLATRVFKVVNDTDEILAIKASVSTREWLIDREKNAPTRQFELFPAQLILKAREEKGIRVRWTGDKDIPSELAYRLVIEQLPVNFTQKQKNSAVKVLHRVVGALYVTPADAKPSLSFGNTSQYHDPEKGKLLVFDVINNGTRHTLLNKHKISAQGETRIPLDPELFSQLTTQNVLAGSRLKIQLPWPKGLGTSLPMIVER